MNRNDRTWGQINKRPIHLNSKNIKPFKPVVLLEISLKKRVYKTLKLYLTTRFSWCYCWHLAAR